MSDAASLTGPSWFWAGLLIGLAGVTAGVWCSTSSTAATLFSHPALLGWSVGTFTMTTCVLLPGYYLLQAIRAYRRR